MKKLYLILISSLLLLSACNDNLKGLASISGGLICTLVPTELGEEILQTPFKTVVSEDVGENTGGCQFISNEDKGHITKSFNIIVSSTPNPDDARSLFNQATQIWDSNPLSQRTSKTIENIGDDAFWSYAPGSPQLYAHQQTRFLIITFGQLEQTEEFQLEKATKLATHILQQI